MSDAANLAEQWFTLAESGDLRALCRALAVGKRRKEAARDLMSASPARIAALQQRLLAGLAAPGPWLRAECAHALDTFGDAAARPALARLLDDPVPRVRAAAIHALSCHACSDAKPDALEADLHERIAAAAAGDVSRKVRLHASVALDGDRRPPRPGAAGL
jgi:HEAT repeat protein